MKFVAHLYTFLENNKDINDVITFLSLRPYKRSDFELGSCRNLVLFIFSRRKRTWIAIVRCLILR